VSGRIPVSAPRWVVHDDHPRRRARVLDAEMSYFDIGEGDPIVFLHGNPTWSYVWRNVIPHVASLGRCLAPDLVGMGKSSASPTRSYRFIDHVCYLDAWFDALDLHKVTLVLHDWGSALGFYRVLRYSEQVRAIAHMEAIALPRRWSDFGEAEPVFRALRSPKGEQMICDDNFFIESILQRGVLRLLGDVEMDSYRAPFASRESRLPMIWPREIPIEGQPTDVATIVTAYSEWLRDSALPKLLILGEPGAIVTGRTRAFCERLPNQRIVSVKGRHFLQEDSPHEIGAALAEFIADLPA